MTIPSETCATVLTTVAVTTAYHALVSFTRSWDPVTPWQKWVFLGFTVTRVVVPAAVFVALVFSPLTIEMKLCIGLLLVISGVLQFCSRK